MIRNFHAHIYFDVETRASAEALLKSLGDQFGPKLRHLGRLIDRPIGPHPVPMFEIDFAPELFYPVVSFLMLNHAGHSVLIHPETGDDLTDHTAHALWLGRQLNLDLSRF